MTTTAGHTANQYNPTNGSLLPPAQLQANTSSTIVDDKIITAGPPPAEMEESGWKEGIDDNAQIGVKKAQATTLTWTKTALFATLGW